MTASQTPRAAFHAVASDDARAHGALRVYDDSEGVWDGLAHDGQRFTGLSPLRAATQARHEPQ